MAGTEVQTLVAELILDTRKAQSALRDLNRKLAAFEAGGTGAATAGAKAGADYGKAFNKGLKAGRLGDIGSAAAAGGLKFLERTVLATAAAGVVLELQFLKVQDAQAALARTLDGESAPAIARINKEILELSKVVPLPITELYRLAEVAGTVGIAGKDIGQFTSVVARLAATTDLTADQAAHDMGVLLNIMNLTVDEADNLASALVKLSVSQTSTDQAILTATERFGSLGTAMGFTAAQLLAIGSAGTALGQEPEAVGGSIQRIFSIILRALAEGNEAIDEFSDKPKKLAKVLANMDVGKMAEIAGVGAQAFIEEWEAAPQLALERFLAGFGALTPQQQSLLFGKGGIFPSFVRGQQTLQNLSASQELLKEGSASASAEFERGQFIYEQSALRFDTLKQSLQLLASSVVRAGVAFGDAFDEELGGAIKRITQYITDNEAVFAEWGRKVGAAIKAIDWQQVKQFAADFFGVFKTGVQATVAILDAMGPKLVAFLAIWKTIDALSGGAVTKTLGLLGSGAGGVIKLVWDQFKARGSSPANPLWVQMIGGGLGAGGGVGLLGKVGQAGLVAAIGVVVGTALAGNPTLDGRVPTGGSRAEQFARMARLRAGLDEPPAPPGGPAGFGEKYGPSLSQLGAVVRAGDLQEETNAILNRGFDTTAGGLQGIIDRLPRLKPIHRAGERGKSIQSAEFKALMGLDPSSPTYAAELTKYVADLVEHYKKEPIGSGRHPKGFILPALNRTEKSLAADLKTALASGNTALATTIAERLRDIGGIKGNDLPAGIQKLVNSTLNADAKRETEANRMAEKTGGVKSAVGSVGDRVENLTAALRRKRLSVTVRPTSLQIKQVIPVRNNLSVRISGREVSRSGNTTTSYGPNIVFQIPGAYYGGGGGP